MFVSRFNVIYCDWKNQSRVEQTMEQKAVGEWLGHLSNQNQGVLSLSKTCSYENLN